MTGPFCIRVTAYWGGYDELGEIYIIGPYPTADDRDQDLARISGLKGFYGAAEVEPSTIEPAAADYSASPTRVAKVKTLGGLAGAFYR